MLKQKVLSQCYIQKVILAAVLDTCQQDKAGYRCCHGSMNFPPPQTTPPYLIHDTAKIQCNPIYNNRSYSHKNL